MRSSARAPAHSAPAPDTLKSSANVLRRKCKSCQEDEEQSTLRRKPLAAISGRDLSGVPAHADSPLSAAVPPAGTQALEPSLRAAWEPRFGRSLAHVRVSADAAAARAADALGARAFTLGSSIWFGHNQFQPHTEAGRRLLAHEVAHTLQGSASPRGKLTVGSVDDPAELEADVAADKVMRGERATLMIASSSQLRRQATGADRACTGTRTGPLTATVSCPDGREFAVTGQVTEVTRDSTRLDASMNMDDTNVQLTIRICRGRNEIVITPSVNLPQVVRDAISNALSGRDALGGVAISPSATIRWTLSRTVGVSLSGGPSFDLGSGGTSGGSVGVRVDTDRVTIGADVDLGPDGTPRGGRFTLGVPTARVPRVDCRDVSQELSLSCQQVTTTPPTAPTPETPAHQESEDLFVFFEYETADIRADELPSRERLTELLRLGARVVSVEGFTSPEGARRRRPVPGRRFVGNDPLSAARASAALDWLRAAAPDLVPAGLTAGAASGRGELYSPPDVAGREASGDPLTQHATREFLANDPLRPTDPAAAAALATASPEAQRDTIYPLLRRAHIRLERTVAGTPAQPGSAGSSTLGPSVDCPAGVARAARRVLRS